MRKAQTAASPRTPKSAARWLGSTPMQWANHSRLRVTKMYVASRRSRIHRAQGSGTSVRIICRGQKVRRVARVAPMLGRSHSYLLEPFDATAFASS
nr:hypothetical protein CFP56_19629 [Quercus suber]